MEWDSCEVGALVVDAEVGITPLVADYFNWLDSVCLIEMIITKLFHLENSQIAAQQYY